MRVVFVHINQVEITSGNPRLFFARVTLHSEAASGVGGSGKAPLHLVLRTDIATEPSLSPSFRLSKLHFTLPSLASGGGAGDKKKQQQQQQQQQHASPSNDQQILVTLDVFEISPDARPRLVGSARSNVAALVDSAPPLALVAPPGSEGAAAAQQQQVGVIKATARAFSGPGAVPSKGVGAANMDVAEYEGALAAEAAAEFSDECGGVGTRHTNSNRLDTSEAYAEPGQSGKRLVLTIVSMRNVHAFKNSAVSFAIMAGTAVKSKSAPVLVTGQGEVMHVGLSLNCLVDSTYSSTSSTLATLVAFEREKPRAKFHLTLPPPPPPMSAPPHSHWASHAQLATVLKCVSSSGSTEGLELHVLISALDLTISSPASLIRQRRDQLTHTVFTLDIKETTGPLPISRQGRCLLHAQVLPSRPGSVDAFLNDMMTVAPSAPSTAVAPRHLAKFPLVTFDGSGAATSPWPPAASSGQALEAGSVKSHAKYMLGDLGRSTITDNARIAFYRRVVLTTSRSPLVPVNLAFQLFAVVPPGHEYVLVAYGTLEMDCIGASTGGIHDRVHIEHAHHVRLFPTTAYRTVFATCGRIYLDIGVHVHDDHRGLVHLKEMKRGTFAEEVIDLPLLEPPTQHALLDEFQDMAKSIMDLRLEKQRLERDCARLEVQMASGGAGDSRLDMSSGKLSSMTKDELIECCLGMQNALRKANAQETIKQVYGAKMQNQAEVTQILQDQIKHLQETVSNQQLQLQELQVFRKKADRLKALVHQQETVIQHLERLVSQAASAPNAASGDRGSAGMPVERSDGANLDLELMMRCSKAESRVAALEKQVQELSGQLVATKLGADSTMGWPAR